MLLRSDLVSQTGLGSYLIKSYYWQLTQTEFKFLIKRLVFIESKLIEYSKENNGSR